MASHVCRAISRVTSYWLVLVTMALGLAATARSAGAQVCFPTCSQIDGRFLVVPGGPPSAGDTFANFDIVIGLRAPSSSTLPQVDIFDGDTGGGVNGGHWDQGTTPMDYSIYLDLDGDGQIDAGDTLLVSESGAIMPDNSWFSLTIPAGSPTAANYFLVVHNPDPDTFAWNAFKMRTTGTFEIAPQTFAFLAPLGNINDAQTIYPNYPGLGNTTYDGSWTFAFSVPSPQQSITLFDGDMDFGSWNCTTRDTDDPDTDSIPDFALGTNANPEGVATVTNNDLDCSGNHNPGAPDSDKPTGNPPDDNNEIVFRRTPSIYYELITPDGRHFSNMNPSGNREWEEFTISSDPFEPADYTVAGDLPPGVYTVKIFGMDMSNLNYWHFTFPLIPPTERCPICGTKDKGKGKDKDKDKGKPVSLTFRYTGESCAASNHSQSAKKASCSGDPNMASPVHIVVTDKSKASDISKGKKFFDGTVALGGTFTAGATNAGEKDLKSDTYIHIFSQSGVLLQTLKIHTSCSAPINIGDQFGSLVITAATQKTKAGTQEVTCEPGDGGDFCQAHGKPSAITLQYVGGDCTTAQNSQPPGKKYNCTDANGGPDSLPTVFIQAPDGSFQTTASLNGPDFTVPSQGSNTSLKIYTAQGGQLREDLQIHTSCSAPLIPGETFGALKLKALVPGTGKK